MWIYKSNLNAEHFLSTDNKYNQNYLQQLNDEYEKYKDAPISELSFSSFMKFMRDGDRLTYEKEYFERRTMLRDFALKAWLYGDKTALKRLEDVMWAVCNEFTWALPAHLGNDVFNETIDLFTAETAQALTEIISLLDDKISDIVIKRCITEVKKRALIPFINRNKPYDWENMKNNWSAVCGGCIGMTALYLVEDKREADEIVKSLKQSFESFISSFSDDGACLEGLYYWNYGMTYFTAFIDLYKERMETYFPFDNDKVKKMADFSKKCCISDGFTLSFSDSLEYGGIYSGISFKLNEIYNSAVANEEYLLGFYGDNCGRWCRAARDIAWTKNVNNCPHERKNMSLPISQWSVLYGNDISAAFKGGNNDEPHNHNDVGSVIVIKNGKAILCDIGAGEYTAEYFSDKRYDIFCNRSTGHSVPIINGCEQKAGSNYKADGFFAADNKTGADISGAYAVKALKKCLRTIKCNENTVQIADKFHSDEEICVTERFITRHSTVVKNNEVEIIADGEKLASLTADNQCDIAVKKYENREHNGVLSYITAIDFTFKKSGEFIFSIKIL